MPGGAQAGAASAPASGRDGRERAGLACLPGAAREEAVDGLLSLLARRACQVARVRTCTAYLRAERDGLFRGRIVHNPARPDAPAWVRRSVAGTEADRFTREILSRRAPVVVTNALHDPRPVRSAMRRWQVRSMLGVPMIAGQEVVGLLFLDNGEQPHTYTEREQLEVLALANLGALAVVEARRAAALRVEAERANRRNRLLERATQADHLVMQQLQEGGGPDGVARTVASVTCRPCAILDGALRPLAESSRVGEREEGAAVRSALRSLGGAGAITPLEAGEERIVDPLPGSGPRDRHLVARGPDVAGGFRLVALAEGGRPFTAFDAMVARRAAAVLSLEARADAPILQGAQDADELGPWRLYLSQLSPAGAERLAREALGGLLDGPRGRARLLETLRAFLDCNRSMRNAAAVLGVHENTVRYRLGRIAEVTGLDVVGDPAHHAIAYLAVQMCRLLGRLGDAGGQMPPASGDAPGARRPWPPPRRTYRPPGRR